MKLFTTFASIIFGGIGVVHLLRLIIGFQVQIGSHTVPMWVSIVGIILSTFLSYGLWKEAKIQ